MILGPATGTFAILIGIENYEEPSWALNGPAMDAMRLANWLLDRGVPGNNLHLYINEGSMITRELAHERTTLRQKLADSGVILCERPCRSVLEAALNPVNFPPLPGQLEKTLIVYCSGHGTWKGGEQKRYLIAADASQQSYEAIDLSVVANELCYDSSSNRFSRQWLIQDACAEVSKGQGLRALSIMVNADARPPNEQYLLFASRPGAYAENDPIRQAGAFTGALLDALGHHAVLEGLDVKQLCDAIDATPWGAEHPIVLHRRDEHMAQMVSILDSSTTTQTALEELRDIINQSGKVNTAILKSVIRTLSPSTAPMSSDVMTMLRELGSLVGPAPGDELTNVELFAIRLYGLILRIKKHASDDSWENEDRPLKSWIDKWPGGRSRPTVNDELERLNRDARRIDNAGVIIVDLSGIPDPSETRIWDYRAEAPDVCQILETPGATISERLSSALEQLCSGSGFGFHNDTILELVLPSADLFELQSGTRFSVSNTLHYYLGCRPALLALRIAERWHNRGWYQNWKLRWDEANLGPQQLAAMVWLAPEDRANNDGWSWHGIQHPGDAAHQNTIQQALFEGVAFAAWCEQLHAQNVTNVVQSNIFVNLHNTRLQLAELNTANSPHVTYVLDDPTRIPLGAGGLTSSFQQPAQRR